MAEQTPVCDSVKIDKDVGVSARCRESPGAINEREASRIGIGINEEDLARRLSERGEKCIGLSVGVAQDGDGMPRGDNRRRR